MPPATLYAPARPYNLGNSYGLAGPANSVIYDARGRGQGGYGGYGPTVTRPNPRLTNQVLELLRGASAAGPVHFLPFHGLTAETPEMRRDYRNMLRNPHLKAAVITNVLQVSSLPHQVQPSKWGGPSADEAAANIDYSLDTVDGGFAEMLWNVFIGGMMSGHSVCEPGYDVPAFGPQAGRVTLDTFKGRDDLTYRMDVDAYLNVTAIQGTTFNYGEFFDPNDFLIFSHNKIFENPLGMSDFRSVWPAIQYLDMFCRLELIGLDKFALPFLSATYSSDEHYASLDAALKEARDNGYLLVPKGVEVQILNLLSGGNLDAFQKAKEEKIKEVVIGISGAYLHMLTSGTTDDRGDSGVQKSTSELVPWWLSQRACNLLNRHWVPRQCAWNYGMDCAMPRITVGGVNVVELLNDLKLDEGLLGLGVDLSVEERRSYYGRAAPADPRDSLLMRRTLVGMMGQQPPGGGGDGGGDGGPGGGGNGGRGKPPAGGDGGAETGLAFGDYGDPLDFGDPHQSRGQPHNAGQFGPGGYAKQSTTKPSGAGSHYNNQRGFYGTPTKDLPAALRAPAASGGQPSHIPGALAMLENHFGKGAVVDVTKGLPQPAPKVAPEPPKPPTRRQQLTDLRDMLRRDLATLEGSRDQDASFDRARIRHELAATEAELSGGPAPGRLGEAADAPESGEPTEAERRAASDELATAAEAVNLLTRQLKSAGAASGHGPALAAAIARLTEAGAKFDAVQRRMKLTEAEPLPFADDGDGHWITIGGSKGADGKRHGGSPVFIRNGRIEKGAPNLAGRKLGSIHDEPAGRRGKELAADSAHASEAKRAGVHPDDLHTLAAEMREHDKHLTDERAELLRDAHRRSREKGFSDLRTAALNEYHGRGDADSLRGLDEIATDLAQAYPHHFSGHHDPAQRLHDMILEGIPKRMTREDSYRQALEHLAAHGPHVNSRRHRVSEEPIPFAEPEDAPDAE